MNHLIFNLTYKESTTIPLLSTEMSKSQALLQDLRDMRGREFKWRMLSFLRSWVLLMQNHMPTWSSILTTLRGDWDDCMFYYAEENCHSCQESFVELDTSSLLHQLLYQERWIPILISSKTHRLLQLHNTNQTLYKTNSRFNSQHWNTIQPTIPLLNIWTTKVCFSFVIDTW